MEGGGRPGTHCVRMHVIFLLKRCYTQVGYTAFAGCAWLNIRLISCFFFKTRTGLIRLLLTQQSNTNGSTAWQIDCTIKYVCIYTSYDNSEAVMMTSSWESLRDSVMIH